VFEDRVSALSAAGDGGREDDLATSRVVSDP
jgi:hypothetical protein